MVHDDSVGIDNGNEEEKVKPPNRNAFQREIARLNGEIEFLHGQAKIKLNRDGDAGSISEARRAREAIRQTREGLARQATARKLEINEMRKPLDTLKKGRQEVEKDCRVRSSDKLELYLKNAEQRYKEQNLSVREEKHLVEEIDALKRNRTKLEKLAEFNKKIVLIEEEFGKLKKINDEIYREIYRLKAEQHAQSAELRKRTDDWVRIQNGLDQLHGQKRQLITKYNDQRGHYTEWVKSHRKKALSANSSYPATFPNARARTISCSLVEDEELEPFFEQKRDCKRLIRYLEKLKNQMELPDNVAPTAESDSDSADEFPSTFARLNVQNKKTDESQKTAEPSSKEKRKAPIPKKIKPNHPISHVYEIYHLFSNVQVDVPANYQDVPRALDEVREKASFFEQQTNVIDWYKELGDWADIPLPTMSRSVSEYTGDSACIDSETASVNSSARLFPTSPSDLRNHRNLSFNADEGISSRDSQTEAPSCLNP